MSTTFHARNADAYEQFMGRWSRRLARPFIAFAGLADGERILDVGCGTGSLTFALAKAANLAKIAAIDDSEIYLDAARAKNKDPRISFERADACALPFEDACFDRAMSLLVLHFIPETERAVGEMYRVGRPGRNRRSDGRGRVRRDAEPADVLGHRSHARPGGGCRAGQILFPADDQGEPDEGDLDAPRAA